jgi:hypothetical protein
MMETAVLGRQGWGEELPALSQPHLPHARTDEHVHDAALEALIWHEAPLGRAALSSTDAALAQAVCSSRSVLCVPAFCTPEEVSLLREAGVRAAELQMQNPLTSSESRLRIEVFGRSLGITPMNLYAPPLFDTLASDCRSNSLGSEVQELATILVHRAIALVQSRNAALADGLHIRGCTPDSPLSYSAGEPAINVYYAGGDFRPHRDAQSFTLLLPLSSPSEYEGGGTAFYEPTATPAEAVRGMAAPIATLRPLAGTALLWGGELTHAAVAVTKGRRLVFVASATPRSWSLTPLW